MVEMLSLNDRKVFWDRKLEAGDRWDEVIQSSVERSNIFVLFWCCDTHASDYTLKEVALALRLKKKIVPVKLCPAAMPQPLNDWQWIDLQTRVQHECGVVDHAVPGKPFPEGTPTRSGGKKKWVLASAVACLVSVIAVLTQRSMMISSVPNYQSVEMPSVAATVDVDRPQIPRSAIRIREGYVVIQPPEGSPGTIRQLDKRGRFVASYTIPLLPPVPPLPELRETPLPFWYVHRAPLLWITGSIVLAALLIRGIFKRRARTTDD